MARTTPNAQYNVAAADSLSVRPASNYLERWYPHKDTIMGLSASTTRRSFATNFPVCGL